MSSEWDTMKLEKIQVQDWDGLASSLLGVNTKHLDMRNVLMPDNREVRKTWRSDCVRALSKINTLVKLDLCRCSSDFLEEIVAVCPQLEYISARAIKNSQINMTNLGNCQNLIELNIKGLEGMTVINVSVLMNLTKLKHLSLITVKNMVEVLEVVGKMTQLESLELGEMINVAETHVIQGFSQLTKLTRLRLEKGKLDCPTNAIMQTISKLPSLNHLELINFDITKEFEAFVGKCSNISTPLLVPINAIQVNTLVKLNLCRCTSKVLEQIAAICPQLEYISARAIKSCQISLTNLRNCSNLTELKLRGLEELKVEDVSVLLNLKKLNHLSLTVVKNMAEVLELVGKMTQLESLELGEMIRVTQTHVILGLSQLTKLRRLRLEKGQQDCPTDAILRTISLLPSLIQLELINFDVKAGFEVSLARCSNIRILFMIPTYVTQSAHTNHFVIEGVSKLNKTLNYFVWGLTLELLKVTDLFINQWEMGQKMKSANNPTQYPTQNPQENVEGDSIPIMNPAITDCMEKEGVVMQVDVLRLPKVHKLLTTRLPNTKILILKIPFSATWRQTISGVNY